jgi:TRAP-type C4-dicarboxylate transport system permease small subunit
VRLLDELLRVPYGAALTAAAVFFGWWAYEVFSNLWAEYRDGSDTTYLTIGGALTVLAVSLASLAFRVLRGTRLVVKVISVSLGVISVSALVGLFAS